ncbi:MAG: aminoglycoside phosphotransferase family protein [Rhodospirillales bacterium]|jgi:aminoglycoside/choline kinase family phosphotransferase
MTERSHLIEVFLEKAGWADARRSFLAGDASFRRYERIERNGHTAVLMDAPPSKEDVRPFVKITDHLFRLGYSAPKIFAEDIKEGFLLLEDLGKGTFTNALAAGVDEEKLYKSAVDVLIDLHGRHLVVSVPADTPAYNNEKLLAEVALFTNWYMAGILGNDVSDYTKNDFLAVWRKIISEMNTDAETLVLRDFHADNLMWLPDRAGIQKCGLLDYQDAIIGSPVYDLMSLLEDARRDLKPGLSARLLDYYYAAFPGLDQVMFKKAYAILAAQRHCKVIGIFSRLAMRDGKYDYLAHMPRCWKMLERTCLTPELDPLKKWLNTHIPAAKRTVPIPNLRA